MSIVQAAAGATQAGGGAQFNWRNAVPAAVRYVGGTALATKEEWTFSSMLARTT